MKTVLKNTKRFAAVFLALAMVVLSLPSSALTTYAAENDTYDVVDGQIVANEAGTGVYTENAEGQLTDAEGNVVYEAGAWSVAQAGTTDGNDGKTEDTGSGFTSDVYGVDKTENAITLTDSSAAGLNWGELVLHDGGESGEEVTDSIPVGDEHSLTIVATVNPGYKISSLSYNIGVEDVSLTLTDGKVTIEGATIAENDITIKVTAIHDSYAVTVDDSLSTNFDVVYDPTLDGGKMTHGADGEYTLTITAKSGSEDYDLDDVLYKIGSANPVSAKSGNNWKIPKSAITGAVTLSAKVIAPVDYDISSNAKVASGKTNPTTLKYGEDLTVYFQPNGTNVGSVNATASVVTSADAATDYTDVPLTAGSGNAFTLTWTEELGTALKAAADNKLKINAVGVASKLDVKFVLDKDGTIISKETNPTTVAYEETYSFSLSPKAGYKFVDETALTAASNLTWDTFKEGTVTVYAITHGKTTTDNSADLYPVTLALQSDGTITGTVAKNLDNQNITNAIDIYISGITVAGEYNVTLYNNAGEGYSSLTTETTDQFTSAKATYKGDDFMFTVATTGTYSIDSVTYTVGDVEQGAVPKSGNGYRISSSKITGDVEVTIETTQIEACTVIVDVASELSSVKYSIDNKTWKTTITDLGTLETNTDLYIQATAAKGYDIAVSDIEQKVSDTVDNEGGKVYAVTDITPTTGGSSSKATAFKITGKIKGSGTIPLHVTPVYAMKVTVTDKNSALSDLQIAIEDTEGGAFDDYKAYKAQDIRDGKYVKLRFKLSDDGYKNSTRVSICGVNNATLVEDGSYWAMESPVAVTSAISQATITVGDYSGDILYIYNGDPTNVNSVKLATDSGTANAAYMKDYKTATTKKYGVLKRSVVGNSESYTVFDPQTAANTKALVFTVNTAAGTLPVISSDNDTYNDNFAAINAAIVEDGPNTKNTYTIAVSKSYIADGDTITIESTPVQAAPIVVVPDSNSEAHYTVTASSNGIALTDAEEEYPSVYEFVAESNAKVLVTVTADTGYTLKSASIQKEGATKPTAITPKTTVDKEGNVSSSFSYTATADLTAPQVITVESAGVLEAGDLTGLQGTFKTAKNKNNEYETTATYTTLQPYELYTIDAGWGELNSEDGVLFITDVTVSDTKKAYVNDPDDEYAQDDENWGVMLFSGAKNIKVDVTVADSGADNANTRTFTAYTLSAYTALESITTVGSVKNEGTIKQEVGTKKTYAVKGTSGASFADVEIEGGSSTGIEVTWNDAHTALEISTHAKLASPVEPEKIILYVESLEGSVGYEDGEELFTFEVEPTASTVTEKTKPTITQKSATDESMVVTLGLPNSAKTVQKNIADGGSLWYAVSVTDANGNQVNEIDGEDADVLLVPADKDGKNQDVTLYLAARDDAEGKALDAQDFTVTATLFVLGDAIEGDTPTEDELTEAVAVTSESKKLSTKATAYPTSVTLKAVTSTLYAGAEDDFYKPSLVLIDTTPTPVVVLANITTNTGASVLDDDKWEVADVTALSDMAGIYADEDGTVISFGENDDENHIAGLGATVVNNQLVVPAENVDHLKNILMDRDSATYTLRVTAPKEDEKAQDVYGTIKLTLTQKAILEEPAQEFTDHPFNTIPTEIQDVTLVKAAGKAATKQLGVKYLTKADFLAIGATEDEIPGLTKAALNQFTYTIANPLNITNDTAGVTVDKNGKVSINKDWVFPLTGNVTFDVVATSAANSDVKFTWHVSLTPAEYAQVVGDLVFAVPEDTDGDNTSDGVWIYDGTLGYTPAMLDDLEAGFFLLQKGAVIKDGFVEAEYLLSDSFYEVTSGNTKVLVVEGGELPITDVITIPAYEAVPTGAAVGTVTVTAVAQNTGTKKTVSVKVVNRALANTKTLKQVFTIKSDGITASDYANGMKEGQKYNAGKPTLAVTPVDNVVTLQVGVVDLKLDSAGKITEKTAEAEIPNVDDLYAATLTAGTGTKILNSKPAEGLYKISMYGATAQVKLNGVTYTLTNAAAKTGTVGAIKQVDGLYGNSEMAQTVTFTLSQQLPSAMGYALIQADNTSEASEAFFDTYLDTGHDGFVPVATNTASGKTTFSLAFTAAANMPNGTYDLYATFANGNTLDNVQYAPQKFQVKVTTRPNISLKTTYDVAITGSTLDALVANPTALTLTDSKGAALTNVEIKSVRNLNTNGVYNGFTALFGNVVPSNAATIPYTEDVENFLAAKATDLKGVVVYTTDGGVTEKEVTITLKLSVIPSAYGAQITETLNAAKDTWSAEYVTQQQVLNWIKEECALPSNLTVAWSGKTFTYTGVNIAGTGATIDGTLDIKDTKAKTSESLIIPQLTIPNKEVTVTTYGLASLKYSVKDGGNGTKASDAVTTGATTTGADGTATLNVLNGATLSITNITNTADVTPDSYYVKVDKAPTAAVEKTQKAAPGVIGKITADTPAVITALQNVTVKKVNANISQMDIAYKNNAGGDAAENDVTDNSASVVVKANTEVIVKATPKPGYDVILTGKNGKAAIAEERPDGDGQGGKLTFTAVKPVGTTTITLTPTAHVFEVTIDTDAVTSLYNKVEFYSAVKDDDNGIVKGWNTYVNEVPVAFGSTLQVRLTKTDEEGLIVDPKTVGAWTVYAYQTNATKALTLKDTKATKTAAGTTTFTTEKLGADNDVVTVSAAQNAGVRLTSNNTKTITAMKTGKANYTNKNLLVVPEGAPYNLNYTVREGYEDVLLLNGEEVEEAFDATTRVRTIKGVASYNDETPIYDYTVDTIKSTTIGNVVNGANVPSVAAAKEAITEATWAATGESGSFDEIGTPIVRKDALNTSLVLTAKMATGYDLTILTVAPGGKKTTVKASTNGALKQSGQTYTYTTTITDNIAEIQFCPVAQSRTFKVTNNASTTVVKNLKYEVVGSGKAAATLTSGKAVTDYYGQNVKITFTVADGYTPTVKIGGESVETLKNRNNYSFTFTQAANAEYTISASQSL